MGHWKRNSSIKNADTTQQLGHGAGLLYHCLFCCYFDPTYAYQLSFVFYLSYRQTGFAGDGRDNSARSYKGRARGCHWLPSFCHQGAYPILTAGRDGASSTVLPAGLPAFLARQGPIIVCMLWKAAMAATCTASRVQKKPLSVNPDEFGEALNLRLICRSSHQADGESQAALGTQTLAACTFGTHNQPFSLFGPAMLAMSVRENRRPR